jgi:hypothetical protein
MQLTERDDEMMQWLSVVRLAEMDSIRWALAGLAGRSEPVVSRVAQTWVSRLVEVELVDRTMLSHRSGSIIRPTRKATGRQPADLFRQTTRHELAVAAASARYLAHGFEWSEDPRPAQAGSARRGIQHRADGSVLLDDGQRDLIEVELTPKSPARYRAIFSDSSLRLWREGIHRLLYFGTADSVRAVERAKVEHRSTISGLEDRILAFTVYDRNGRWTSNTWPAAVGSRRPVDEAPASPAEAEHPWLIAGTAQGGQHG